LELIAHGEATGGHEWCMAAETIQGWTESWWWWWWWWCDIICWH